MGAPPPAMDAALLAVLDDFTPVAAMLLDSELCVVWASSTAVRALPGPPDDVADVIGRAFVDIARPGLVTDELLALLREGLERRVDTALSFGDQRERDVSVFPVDVDGRRCVGFVTVMITAAVHRALDEHELRESLLADAAQLGVWRLDLRDNSLEGNSWYRTVNDVGTPDTPRFRSDVAVRIHPDDLARVNATVDRAVETGEPYTMKYRLVGPGGEAKTVQSRGRVVPGRQHQVIGVVMDVTASESAAEREAELRQMAATASDAERDRIAADLHDGPLQRLSAAWMKLGAIARAVDASEAGDEMRSGLRSVTELLAETNAELRDLMGRLRSLPVGSSTDAFLDELGDVAARVVERSGLDVHVVSRFDGDLPLADTLLSTMFRVLGEALANVEKHAQATTVTITVGAADGELVGSVVDDGQGFDATAPRPSGHFGLSVMSQRAAAERGSVEVVSAPGSGTTVRVALPLDPFA